MARDRNDLIERLYYDEYGRLFQIAYRKTKNRELAQDMVQETFLLATFQRKKLAEHPKPEAWRTRTLYNLAANEQRLQSHQEISLDEAAEVPEKTEDIPFSELLPVQLKQEDREILIWRFEWQMNYREMAKRLGISEDACRKRVVRAVNKCRKYL